MGGERFFSRMLLVSTWKPDAQNCITSIVSLPSSCLPGAAKCTTICTSYWINVRAFFSILCWILVKNSPPTSCVPLKVVFKSGFCFVFLFVGSIFTGSVRFLHLGASTISSMQNRGTIVYLRCTWRFINQPTPPPRRPPLSTSLPLFRSSMPRRWVYPWARQCRVRCCCCCLTWSIFPKGRSLRCTLARTTMCGVAPKRCRRYDWPLLLVCVWHL